MDEDVALLEGFISVNAALMGKSRKIHSLTMRSDKHDGQTRNLERLARAANIPITRTEASAIDTRVDGKTHGGIIAEVGSRRFIEMNALVTPQPVSFIAMLDGVEDPFNFGAAVRSLYAAGAEGLIVRPRNWLSVAGTVARASAGASELIPTAIAETAADAADFFRERGFAIACATDEPGSVSLYDTDLTVPLFLLIGGEKRGITRSFLDQADLKLRIPYGRPKAHSLGTAAATAVLAFEILRQRSEKTRG